MKIVAKPFHILLGCVLLDIIGVGMIIPNLPKLSTSMGATPTQYGLIGTFYGVGQIISGPFCGSLSDKLGRKAVLMVSFIGSCVCYGSMGLANGLFILYSCRLGVGLIKQTIAMAEAYISDITTSKERTMAMTFLSTASALGFTIGPMTGGILGKDSPRLPFYLASAIFAIVSVAAYILLPANPERPDQMPESHPRLPAAKDGQEVNTWCPIVGDTSGPNFDMQKRPIAERLKLAYTDFMSALGHASSQPFLGRVILIRFLIDVSSILMQSILLMHLQMQFNMNTRATGMFLAWTGVVTIITSTALVRRFTRFFGNERKALAASFLIGSACYILASVASGSKVFALAITGITVANTVINTCLLSILTQASPSDKVGSTLGLSASLQSICRVFCPLVGGLMQQYSQSVPFLISALILGGLTYFWWISSYPQIVRAQLTHNSSVKKASKE